MSALSPSHLSGGRFTYGNVYDSNYCSNLISLVVTVMIIRIIAMIAVTWSTLAVKDLLIV